MNKKQFAEAVVNAINEITKGNTIDLEVDIKEIDKANEQKLLGLVFKTSVSAACPTIYVEQAYEDFKGGASIEDIADGMVKSFYRAMDDVPAAGFDSAMQDYNNVMEKITVKALELDRNRDYAEDKVYMDLENGVGLFLDIRLGSNEDGFFHCAVTKSLRESWAVTDESLWSNAIQSAVEVAPPTLVPMGNALFGEAVNLLDHPDDIGKTDDCLFVLSNKDGFYGASSLFIPYVPDDICEILGEGFFALPCSVHEMIIVPDSASMDLDELRQIVHTANRSVVDEKDVLSDNVFHFSKTSGLGVA